LSYIIWGHIGDAVQKGFNTMNALWPAVVG